MVTVKRAQPKSTSKYVADVYTRMTGAQAQRLAEVQALEPALPSRADAVRRLIEALDDDDLDRAVTTLVGMLTGTPAHPG